MQKQKLLHYRTNHGNVTGVATSIRRCHLGTLGSFGGGGGGVRAPVGAALVR